jgi:hypothetical protein
LNIFLAHSDALAEEQVPLEIGGNLSIRSGELGLYGFLRPGKEASGPIAVTFEHATSKTANGIYKCLSEQEGVCPQASPFKGRAEFCIHHGDLGDVRYPCFAVETSFFDGAEQ